MAEENCTNASTTTTTTIQRYFNVDDLPISLKDGDEAVHLFSELSDLLAAGGFQLAKKSSNCREVLQTIAADLLAPQLSKVDFPVINRLCV